jgi:hypothetical protein
MAVYRPTPKCPFCGADSCEAVYKQVDVNFIGDSFSHWVHKPHTCNKINLNMHDKLDWFTKQNNGLLWTVKKN